MPAKPTLAERVRALLATDDREGALELVVSAWRAHRAPALADLIDAIDASDPRFEPYSSSSRAWLVAAKKASLQARGRLIAGIQGRSSNDTFDLLQFADRWEDPRLTHALVGLLSGLPWLSVHSRYVWETFCRVAERLGDPRFIALASPLPATWTAGGDERVWLEGRLATAWAAIAARGTIADKHPAIAELAAELRAPAVSWAPASPSAHALLAAIYAHPEDDGPRAVLADHLQECGDPRGQFIAMQLRGRDDAATRKRERALLQQHRKLWLGELARVLRGDVLFRRGFPYCGTIMFRTERDVELYGALPAWATFEDLAWSHQLVRADQRTWARYIGPAMANVVVARGPLLDHLLAARAPWHRLRTLELDANALTATAIATIGQAPLFPALVELAIVGWGSEPSWLAGVTRCPPHLAITAGLDDPDRDAWLATAAVTPLVSITFRHRGQLYRFTRETPRGAFTRLDIEVHPPQRVRSLDPPPASIAELAAALRRLPPGSLTHFDARIEVAGALVPATPVLPIGRAKLRRT